MWREGARVTESASAGDHAYLVDGMQWRCQTDVEDFDAVTLQKVAHHHIPGNVLLNGGADVIWERVITKNPSTSSTGAVIQALSTDNAVIGISTSTAAAAASQTGLQGSTKWYSTMVSSYPAHTTGTSTAARSVQFRSSFSATEANIAWNEWVVANSSGGRHINRKVQVIGTKTTSITRVITVTFTLS